MYSPRPPRLSAHSALIPASRSTQPHTALELKLHTELEVAHQVGAAVGDAGDAPRVSVRAGRIPDVAVGIIEVHVIEQIHRLEAELQLLRLGEQELLEQRSIRPPVPRPAQGVSL